MGYWMCITHISAVRLSRRVATDKYPCFTHSQPCINCHPDVTPAHVYCYANTHDYAYTLANLYSGTNWLSKAARGLYAPRGQRLDD